MALCYRSPNKLIQVGKYIEVSCFASKHFLINKYCKAKKVNKKLSRKQKIGDWKTEPSVWYIHVTRETNFGIQVFQMSQAWWAKIQERKENHWSYLMLFLQRQFEICKWGKRKEERGSTVARIQAGLLTILQCWRDLKNGV